MGILDASFNCKKCNKTLWLKYYKLPDGEIVCPECYSNYINRKEIEERVKLQRKKEELEKKKKIIESQIEKILDKKLGELIYNFFEKYKNNPDSEGFKKLDKLLRKKYKLEIDNDSFQEIIKKTYEVYKENKELEEFEKEILPDNNKKVEKKYYCIVCKKNIDKKTYEYSYRYFNKPLCKEHQGTKQHRNLFFELKKRGVNCEFEAYDGYKHVDLAIHDAKLYIEIDGSHHSTKPDQVFSDIMRDKYSNKGGYVTKRYSNKMINENLDKIADALCEVVKKIQNK